MIEKFNVIMIVLIDNKEDQLQIKLFNYNKDV